MLWVCTFWLSRNGSVQMIHLTPTRHRFSKVSKVFGCVAGVYFFNVEWVKVCKMTFFKRNCLVKWVIFVASFCWLGETTRKSKINRSTALNKKFWIIYFLIQISYFVTIFENFSRCNFKIFRGQQTMVPDIFKQLPQHKKAF